MGKLYDPFDSLIEFYVKYFFIELGLELRQHFCIKPGISYLTFNSLQLY